MRYLILYTRPFTFCVCVWFVEMPRLLAVNGFTGYYTKAMLEASPLSPVPLNPVTGVGVHGKGRGFQQKRGGWRGRGRRGGGRGGGGGCKGRTRSRYPSSLGARVRLGEKALGWIGWGRGGGKRLCIG